jgi:transcriptional regulator with XRE-family HTH domain
MLGKALSVLILRLRLEKGYSQEELAELADIHVNYISFLERNKRKPTLEVIYKISKALDLSLSEFVIYLEKELEKQ